MEDGPIDAVEFNATADDGADRGNVSAAPSTAKDLLGNLEDFSVQDSGSDGVNDNDDSPVRSDERGLPFFVWMDSFFCVFVTVFLFFTLKTRVALKWLSRPDAAPLQHPFRPVAHFMGKWAMALQWRRLTRKTSPCAFIFDFKLLNLTFWAAFVDSKVCFVLFQIYTSENRLSFDEPSFTAAMDPELKASDDMAVVAEPARTLTETPPLDAETQLEVVEDDEPDAPVSQDPTSKPSIATPDEIFQGDTETAAGVALGDPDSVEGSSGTRHKARTTPFSRRSNGLREEEWEDLFNGSQFESPPSEGHWVRSFRLICPIYIWNSFHGSDILTQHSLQFKCFICSFFSSFLDTSLIRNHIDKLLADFFQNVNSSIDWLIDWLISVFSSRVVHRSIDWLIDFSLF